MRILNRILSLRLVVVCMLAGAAASVILAFFQADRAGAIMATPGVCIAVMLGTALLILCSCRAAAARRWVSLLLHGGCALIAIGWLRGRVPAAFGIDRTPETGMMPLVDGDELNILLDGAKLDTKVCDLPFSIRLEKFFVEEYPDGSIREYRSRITVKEPGKEPYVRNVRVNHPVRVGQYDIYQMSWGRTQDAMTGAPITYTILQFIRDPGLSLVYAGYAVLFIGVLAYTLSCFRMGKEGMT